MFVKVNEPVLILTINYSPEFLNGFVGGCVGGAAGRTQGLAHTTQALCLATSSAPDFLFLLNVRFCPRISSKIRHYT